MAAGLGGAGRRATTVLAVALAMATMNVYLASAARLASALSRSRALPAWLAGDGQLSVPRRPLVVIGGIGLLLLAALAVGLTTTTVLVRATSACFVAVYVAATASAVRILHGRVRLDGADSGPGHGDRALLAWYLFVPAASAACFAVIRAHTRRSRSSRMARCSPLPAQVRVRSRPQRSDGRL